MSENDKRPVVGITHGDINSISYEIIIKSFVDNRIFELITPVVYGSSKIASYHRKMLNVSDFSFNLIKKADMANPKRANIVNIHDQEVKIEMGKSTQIAGELALLALENATEDLKKGLIDVLVTAPINKQNIQSKDFHFPGHTEYLANKFGATDYLMLMVSNKLRIGVVTGHMPLREVPGHLTEELLLHKIRILHQSLVQDFAIQSPRIALLGINPHAGDSGLLGSEETNVITPAIQKAFGSGMMVFGPFPADGFFGSSNYTQFDGILAMYHDQGMLPFKTLSFDSGVNFTAGLPVIRTSPAHGTAYEIAGKDMASPDSFRAALYLAADIYYNRRQYKEITANPLQLSKQETEK
ncbi:MULTISPECIES: 4-hydroxythreonine-4-phosphate dehydrogenase PdxA [Lentimicrobium]|jgi:4-hydroxythreonine-4-phosphate dehydrogenase|uniref:4-hydroxythreonine-4-phosphate dehydrogenase n=1 Tax=Lentimicrobium saccharophilum TaxID=1678841 RepID=A0A0S7C3X5_9BACT|nr:MULTISPECIES: 4-hydroxythreonine-4-phosphate dehydrogenase PdxA [Lentimicrobium]MCO5257814.1 4-hydroxythreonine-4-phosphate dehydrogenase PdxA [Lentimicrobium sp.]MCO5262379.1 4-hydroxythreonine-4-phosphate dehydrogenase PdxA [Lentimicrobium sp.]GAP43487.1 4-hydroxythreonine-4-phosphate dehydrogenase [Lentimicrobium saccharophilum]HPJ63581.1 4-hydroxythreonine-4-phosphate dehydrogenase PdxA [Lentimicrobium sp.]HPR26874.1 4-hydroxythreonine-4-phosphate dehydrogenase PdxA [Lentimicrobium sp.]